jgi:hypothetical protein
MSTELFSIKEGQTKSLGVRVEMATSAGETSQNVVPELAVCREENGPRCIGAFIWQGGSLGDLWDGQVETLQFILDNVGKI